MTREQFLSQYTGEWSPSDGHWFGLDFGWRGQEYRFQTDSMYHPANTVLPQCRIQGMPLGDILEDESTELLGQD